MFDGLFSFSYGFILVCVVAVDWLENEGGREGGIKTQSTGCSCFQVPQGSSPVKGSVVEVLPVPTLRPPFSYLDVLL